ncbi:MAG: hypothetical protein FWD68_04985 [Alphaproteobacteria bacterium]|nr:hypothetical protein [Alphaproteobacteria bacterium]
MSGSSLWRGAGLAAASALTLLLGACATNDVLPAKTDEVRVMEIPARIRPEQIVGRWGLASFTNPADRPRTEVAARAQCKNPYVINMGASGGVVMHLADQATPQELRLKGSQEGRDYIGPPGPPGGEQDREIVSFDNDVMITRYIDKDTATRYGTMIFARCGAPVRPEPRHSAGAQARTGQQPH